MTPAIYFSATGTVHTLSTAVAAVADRRQALASNSALFHRAK